MNGERYVLRDEYFGGTLYDRELLKHHFVSKEEISSGIEIDGQKVSSFEAWPGKTDNLPEGLLYAPTRIYFELTRGCNLRCIHCFNSSDKPMPNEMNTDQMMRSLDGLREDNVFDLRFTGGEVTTRPDWFIILKRAKELGFTVSINTNGVYQDPDETTAKLASLDLNQITISIDGDREHHERIRGKRTFDKSLAVLKVLKEKGAKLRTNTVVTRLSLDDAEKIVSIVSPYVDEVAFFHMRMTGRAQNVLDKAVTFEELYEFNVGMEELKKKFPHINMFFGELAMVVNSTISNRFNLKLGGPDGFTRFNLLADGSVWAGGYVPYIDPTLNLGNVKDESYSVLNIWRNSAVLNEFREWSGTLVKRCLDCPEFNRRCPGVNVEMELIRKRFPNIGNPYCIY
jgi:MoaA/NifB/PqqE/SkfB family radical SAM enzyme